MDDRQRRENERNIRAEEFLTANLSDFSGNTVAQAKIGQLTAKVAKTQEEYQKQLAGGGDVRQDYFMVNDAYETLLDELRDVRDFAASISAEHPGMEHKFRLARQGGKRAFIAAARIFADDALDYKQLFIDYGMDADFISVLREKADDLEEALAEADSSVGDRTGATDTLGLEIKAANKIVEILNPVVRRTYRANPAKLAAWVFASHVERHTPKSKSSQIKPKND